MRIIISHPEHTAQAYAPSVVDDPNLVPDLIDNLTPAIFIGEAAKRSQYLRQKPGLKLRITKHRKQSRSFELKLRASFSHAKQSYYWSFTATLKIAIGDSSGQEIIKTTISGKPAAVPAADRDFQMNLFSTAFATFADRLEKIPTLVPGAAISPDAVPALCGQILAQIGELIAGKDAEAVEKADLIAARHEALNELPDGTPLKIRASTFARNWQVGMKRGAIPKAQAPHVCLIEPEAFATEELRKSAISTHQLLPLMAAAQAAKAQASDDLFDFHSRSTYGSQNGLPLNADMPLHQSFRVTEDVKKRRRDSPKIWAQTNFRNMTYGYTVLIDGKRNGFTTGRMPGSRGHPSFPDANSPRITKIHSNPDDIKPRPLASFCFPAGIFVVSDEIARLLSEHNIGRSALEPIQILNKDKKPIDGSWYHLMVREEVRAVRPQHTHPDLLKSMSRRAAKPYELRVLPSAPGDLDLWTDPQLVPQGVFLSDALHKALKKADALPPLGFRRCDTT